MADECQSKCFLYDANASYETNAINETKDVHWQLHIENESKTRVIDLSFTTINNW